MSSIRTAYICEPFMCEFACKQCEVMTWSDNPPVSCPYRRKPEWKVKEQKKLQQIREEKENKNGK